ncbi:MAG TPA: FmdE family protein [Herpetosiphonaceae bacterium]
MPAQLQAMLEAAAALHDHLCPRQVLGVRIGVYAGELLGLDLPQRDKRLWTFVESDGCFADGVAAATGCWLGRRTLRLVDLGKIAATFVDTQTGRAVRIRPSPYARDRAMQHAPHAASRWHAYLDAYQTMPTTDLLDAQPVVLTVEMAKIISRPDVRVMCQRCAEEIINEREVLRAGAVLCQSCAGDAYYRSADEQH